MSALTVMGRWLAKTYTLKNIAGMVLFLVGARIMDFDFIHVVGFWLAWNGCKVLAEE